MNDNIAPSSYNGFEFFWNASNNMGELRKRYLALGSQLICGTILTIVFTRNFWRSIIVVVNFPHKFAPQCCLFINTLGILVLGAITVPAIGLNGLSCRTMGWCIIFGVGFSSIACNFMLLERAYVAFHKRRWFLIVGTLFSFVPSIGFLLITAISSSVVYGPNYACHLDYPNYLPYARIFSDLPQNLMFSTIFCMIIYRNYRRRNEHMWKELARDGITTMLLVSLSNIVSFALGESKALGAYTNTIYIADW
jgi:hypothetical protein